MAEAVRQGWGCFSRRSAMAAAAAVAGAAAIPGMGWSQTASAPIKVGGTLALTGPLAASATIHKLGGEIFVDQINAAGGLLGRKVEWMLLDDQSKPEIARALYERLVTSEHVDLLIGPYATGAILSAMSVAERYGKTLIHDSFGVPSLAKYKRQFPVYALGYNPEVTGPASLLDALAASGNTPRSVAILTSKFPSAQFIAKGMAVAAREHGMDAKLYLEYEAGTRDFGPIAARVRSADADLLWVGALGLDGNLLLESLAKLNYRPRSHFYLYPSPAPLTAAPGSNGAVVPTLFEDLAPLNQAPGAAEFARDFRSRAQAARLAYDAPDGQAGEAFAAWQVLAAAVRATGSLDDQKLAEWLSVNAVDTIIGRLEFSGAGNYGPDLQRLKQLRNGDWAIVWPKDVASASVAGPSN